MDRPTKTVEGGMDGLVEDVWSIILAQLNLIDLCRLGRVNRRMRRRVEGCTLWQIVHLQQIRPNPMGRILFAAERGYLGALKWLLSDSAQYEIHYQQDLLFRTVCQHRHLHLARWLLATYPTINHSLASSSDPLLFVWLSSLPSN